MNSPGGSSRKQILSIIWAAMIGSIPIYWFINGVVRGQRPTQNSLALFAQILAGFAVVAYAFAWWWFRWSIGSISLKVTPTNIPQLAEQDRQAITQRLQTSVIICCAFLESPPIWGLVNSIASTPYPYFFEWSAAFSILGFLILRFTGFPAVFELLDRLDTGQSATSMTA